MILKQETKSVQIRKDGVGNMMIAARNVDGLRSRRMIRIGHYKDSDLLETEEKNRIGLTTVVRN